MTEEERFDAANTPHDGHLTEDQAKAAQKGYVTMDDLKAYQIQLPRNSALSTRFLSRSAAI
jgi:hypothetical protein